jgi:transposase-like protein
VTPSEVDTDAAPVYPAVLDDLLPGTRHHVEQYTNNPIEADHGQLKAPPTTRCADYKPIRPRKS